jgi:hypothetical protein
MSAGRPSKYNEETQAKADWYLANYKELGDKVPTAAGLAVYLDVGKNSLYEWAKHHEIFSTTLARLNAIQEYKLTQGGLGNDYNPTITKLMLANHGYSEKNQTELTGRDGGAIEQKFIVEFVDSDDEQD